MFGTFLTWMQEKTAPVFVIATANQIALLPPEMMRKGRFDEIFFIDLPTDAERRVIFSLHLSVAAARPARRWARWPSTTRCSTRWCAATEGFSGAEIEQVVISACFDAFHERRALTGDDLLREIAKTVPLSVTQAEQIAALRAWADVRAVAASTPEDREGYTTPEIPAVASPPSIPRPCSPAVVAPSRPDVVQGWPSRRRRAWPSFRPLTAWPSFRPPTAWPSFRRRTCEPVFAAGFASLLRPGRSRRVQGCRGVGRGSVTGCGRSSR